MIQPPIPEGSIIITPTEVYNEVKSLTEAVRQLVAQDAAEVESRRELKARVDLLDTRLTAVERKMLLFTGAAAAVGAGVGTWLPGLLGA
jgi:hypothetical protein